MDEYKLQDASDRANNVGKTEELTQCIQSLAANSLAEYCKQFCQQNKNNYRCGLDSNWGLQNIESELCAWSEASINWALSDIQEVHKSSVYANRKRVSLRKNVHSIMHSLAFRDRFKDWRFRSRIRVPGYITALDRDAHKIYWWICDKDTPFNIAQRLGRAESEIVSIISRINAELLKRNKNVLLDCSKIIELGDVSSAELSPIKLVSLNNTDAKRSDNDRVDERFTRSYQQLDWLEQYLFDTLILDGLSIDSVLYSLQEQQLSVDAIPSQRLTEDHVYAFLFNVVQKLIEASRR